MMNKKIKLFTLFLLLSTIFSYGQVKERKTYEFNYGLGFYNYFDKDVEQFDLRDGNNVMLSLSMHGTFKKVLNILWDADVLFTRNRNIITTGLTVGSDLLYLAGVKSKLNNEVDLIVGYRVNVLTSEFVDVDKNPLFLTKVFSGFSHGYYVKAKYIFSDWKKVRPFASVSYFNDLKHHHYSYVDENGFLLTQRTSNSRLDLNIGLILLIP